MKSKATEIRIIRWKGHGVRPELWADSLDHYFDGFQICLSLDLHLRGFRMEVYRR